MTARIHTVTFEGIEAAPVEVQVQISAGLPAFSIVGLPDKAVAESRERVRAALTAAGISLPPKRITVNLAPADRPKEGAHFDLPVALGLLAVSGALAEEEVDRFVVIGELGLDGSIAPVPGVLPAAMAAQAYERGLICPAGQGGEALWAGNNAILAADSLTTLINHLRGHTVLPAPTLPKPPQAQENPPDLSDVRGQETARRALEIAAAGGHHLLMIGPPGAGKSMLAARLPGLLPPMSSREALESSLVHSVAGTLKNGRIVHHRPFRAPHHSASTAALIGGGRKVRPGEISLAHHGILFLDELPEFRRDALESLRQPLETGDVSVARADQHVTYPARIQLVAAMNPCRCGHLGTPELECSRAPKCGEDYMARISGPLLDRFDMCIEVPAVKPQDLSGLSRGESSKAVAARVGEARRRQQTRLTSSGITTNAGMDVPAIERFAAPEAAGETLLISAAEKLHLSARSYHRILKVARTIADLRGGETISRADVAEALAFRRPR